MILEIVVFGTCRECHKSIHQLSKGIRFRFKRQLEFIYICIDCYIKFASEQENMMKVFARL